MQKTQSGFYLIFLRISCKVCKKKNTHSNILQTFLVEPQTRSQENVSWSKAAKIPVPEEASISWMYVSDFPFQKLKCLSKKPLLPAGVGVGLEVVEVEVMEMEEGDPVVVDI